jgi:hypothetical protein
MEPKKKAAQQIQIQVNDNVADGEYANLAIITHSSAEFIVDFVRVMPGTPKANVQSRIIMTPSHTKALYRALEQNISKYETEHGEIKMPEPISLPGMAVRPGNMPN